MRRTRQKAIVIGVLLTSVSFFTLAQAETQTVDSWIGRLELQDGYPSKSTVEKLYDEMDFQRATQAFIWTRKPDLVKNADGSVDVFFGPQKPAGPTNWIKSNPGKGWFPYFRFYAPTESYFDKPWQLNDIEPIN